MAHSNTLLFKSSFLTRSYLKVLFLAFSAMADFQYLPMQKKDDGQYESFYDKIVLNKLTSYNEYFNRDVPLFMPPLLFSRVDTPCDFLYKPDIEHRDGYKNPDDRRAPNLIGTSKSEL